MRGSKSILYCYDNDSSEKKRSLTVSYTHITNVVQLSLGYSANCSYSMYHIPGYIVMSVYKKRLHLMPTRRENLVVYKLLVRVYRI